MNLLNLLLGSMTSNSALSALSANTGTTTDQTSSLLSSALPALLGAMTNNASSTEGAQSLLNALGQHTETTEMSQQLANADLNDGQAIIQHILGNNTASVVQSLSNETGVSENQVNSLLDNIAPAVLSGLSAATTSAQNNTSNEGGFDFSDLLSTFGGLQQEAQTQAQAQTQDEGISLQSAAPQASGIFSSLFGGPDNASENTSSGGLFGGNSGGNSGGGLFGGLGNLFSSIFGTAQEEEAVQQPEQNESLFDGSDLLSSLLNRLQ